MSNVIWICLIGVVLNFIALYSAAEKEPEGPMGMQIFFLFALVPYLLVAMWLLSKVVGDKE